MRYLSEKMFDDQRARRSKLSRAQRFALDDTMLAAATRNDNEGINEALFRGAAVNARDHNGNTGLFLTSFAHCARSLLVNHADPTLTNSQGIYPFDHHVSLGNIFTAEVIRKYTPIAMREKLLHKTMERRLEKRKKLSDDEKHELDKLMFWAGEDGNRRELLEYLDQGADATALDPSGNTGLITVNQPKCAFTYLAGGCDPLQPSAEGIPPLIHHINKGHAKVAEVIKIFTPYPILLDMRGAAFEAGHRAAARGATQTRDWVLSAFGSMSP